MNDVNQSAERKTMETAKEELAALLKSNLQPYVDALAAQGLIANSGQFVQRVALSAQFELSAAYRGPRLVMFGRLEDGALFRYGDSFYIKLDRTNARSLSSGEARTFNLHHDVTYDPALESVDPERGALPALTDAVQDQAHLLATAGVIQAGVA